MSNLEARIQHLEDLEAIRHLKHHYYSHCIDRSVAGESAAIEETISRFADDMVVDFTDFPPMEGKEAVAAFFAQGVPALLSWCQHRVMNEVIEIDGDTARGRWYVDCPVVFRDGNPFDITGPGFVGGRYEEEYVRENGVWKWRKITALLDVTNSFSKNWEGVTQLFENR